MRVELVGDKELQQKLRAMIGKAEGPLMVAAVAGAAEIVRSSIKSYVPVRTANLKESISIVIIPKKGKVEAYIGTDEFYGRFQEMGTKKMPAHPYLRPGLTASEIDAKRRIISDLKAHVVRP